MHTYTHTYIHADIHTHTHIYIYIHTYTYIKICYISLNIDPRDDLMIRNSFISFKCRYVYRGHSAVLYRHSISRTYRHIFTKKIKKVRVILECFRCIIGNTAEAGSCCSSRSDGDMLRVWFSRRPFVQSEHGVNMTANCNAMRIFPSLLLFLLLLCEWRVTLICSSA
jgi:hypothetical protein